jgi:tetratricopeptide (TPR) repeat protein
VNATVTRAAPQPEPASDIELEVRRIRALLQERNLSTALARSQALLRTVPSNRDVLLLHSESLRHLGRAVDALESLERLQQLHPRFSQLYQERGRCYVLLREAPRAIEAFLMAVNLNPALISSWKLLQRLYAMTGETQLAATAGGHITILSGLPADIRRASRLFFDGDVGPAEALVRGFLLRNGHHVEAMRLLARISLAQEILDDAEVLLSAVLRLAPGYGAARADYVNVLVRRQKYVHALGEVDLLLRDEPRNADYLALRACALVGIGEHAQAITVYQGLLGDVRTPTAVADVNLWLAHALKTVGAQQQAVIAYRTAAAARPDFGDAWWSLANLKTYRFTDQEIAEMLSAEQAATTTTPDRMHLCFALGKALEDRLDYARSWQFYSRGNALKRATSRYRPEIMEANTRAQMQICTKEFFTARVNWGTPDPDPIFIVGLPRSGSTLLEQILASHPLVEGTQELAEIHRYSVELGAMGTEPNSASYPQSLAHLSIADLRQLGERFLAETRVYRQTHRPYFIDKMPNNFRHLGLIHLMFPNAKIIDARREPLACCFGNFKQLFAHGQEFSYSLEDIARYYRTYLELMTHWNSVLPGKILTVHHEDVVEDLSGNVRRLLEFCALPFEPACLQFHKTVRSVRTASSEQVRRPISRDSLTNWRHYEPWLGPLQEALGDALVRYRG